MTPVTGPRLRLGVAGFAVCVRGGVGWVRGGGVVCEVRDGVVVGSCRFTSVGRVGTVTTCLCAGFLAFFFLATTWCVFGRSWFETSVGFLVGSTVCTTWTVAAAGWIGAEAPNCGDGSMARRKGTSAKYPPQTAARSARHARETRLIWMGFRFLAGILLLTYRRQSGRTT